MASLALIGVLIGLGATVVLDAWTVFRRRVLRQSVLDYRLVGRWLLLMPRGVLVHDDIRRAPAQAGEAAAGWVFHYGSGAGFGLLFALIAGSDWIARPDPATALAFGVATVAAPFLVMQPAFGFGIAASRTPSPGAARIQSVVTHGVFGLGFYLSALALSAFSRAPAA